MEIKTTKEIQYMKPDKDWAKKWIALDDIKSTINYARNHCRGSPDRMKEMLLYTLSNSRPSGADKRTKEEQK